jgi:hypothetical protein
MWTLQCVAAEIHVQHVTLIAGVDNDNCDRLSRWGSHSTVSVEEEARNMGSGIVGTVEVNGDESMMGVLRLCDPRRKMTTESDFMVFWSEVSMESDVVKLHHLIRYLRSTLDLGLVLRPGKMGIGVRLFVDASYGMHCRDMP